MKAQRPVETRPWMLFAFPAGIVVPITAGFLLGGPVLGFLLAGLVAVVIVGVAIRMEPGRSRTTAEAGSEAERVAPAPDETEERGWRRAAGRRLLVPLAIAVVGIALMTTTSPTVSVIGWGTFAVAITVAISLVFLEIGYSEDRARAREERAGRGARHRRPRRSAE